MTPEQIEKSFIHEMKQIIVEKYAANAPKDSESVIAFNKKINVTSRQAWPVWKKLEQMLFDEGEIPFIRNPVGYHKILLTEGVRP